MDTYPSNFADQSNEAKLGEISSESQFFSGNVANMTTNGCPSQMNEKLMLSHERWWHESR